MTTEYPASRGGSPNDKQNFISLLRELKDAFRPKNYLLTAAVSAGKHTMDPGYDVPKMSEYLDIINVMAYDYHGGWETFTGHNAPLYARPDEVGNQRLLNVNFSINYWISQGASRDKIVLGMGTYGRSFTLDRAEKNGFNAGASQKGQAGPYTREGGSLGYNEICEIKRQNPAFKEVFDPYTMAPYAYWDRQWVGYDNIESIRIKTEYAKAMGLRGAMIWSIETDDFRGECGPKFGLLNTIKSVLTSNAIPPIPLPGQESGQQPVQEPEDDGESSSPSTPVSTTSTTTTTTTTTTTRAPTTTTTTTRAPTTASTTTTTVAPSTGRPSSTTPGSCNTSPAASSTTTPSTTTSTTTISAPGNPGKDGPNDINEPENEKPPKNLCKSEGLFRDPTNCSKFINCRRLGGDQYEISEFICAGDTVFNEATRTCDWRYNVPECQRKNAKMVMGPEDANKKIPEPIKLN